MTALRKLHLLGAGPVVLPSMSWVAMAALMHLSPADLLTHLMPTRDWYKEVPRELYQLPWWTVAWQKTPSTLERLLAAYRNGKSAI